MSREIKFRVGKTYFDAGVETFEWNYIIFVSPASIKGTYEKQYDTPWLQFTGLKDKNGVEIYEGDIIKKITDCKGCTGEDSPVVIIGFVEYEDDEARYILVEKKTQISKQYEDFEISCSSYEVIGNIYENPELLK